MQVPARRLLQVAPPQRAGRCCEKSESLSYRHWWRRNSRLTTLLCLVSALAYTHWPMCAQRIVGTCTRSSEVVPCAYAEAFNRWDGLVNNHKRLQVFFYHSNNQFQLAALLLYDSPTTLLPDLLSARVKVSGQHCQLQICTQVECNLYLWYSCRSRGQVDNVKLA